MIFVCSVNHETVYLLCSIFTGWAVHQQELLIVQIYPDTTSFDRIDRDTKNTMETQLALVGGTMGLLTGMKDIKKH